MNMPCRTSPLERVARQTLKLSIAACAVVSPAALASTPGAECLEIIIDEERLACFDRAIRRAVLPAPAQAVDTATPPAAAAAALPPRPVSMFGKAWAVERDSSKALIRLHEPNYILFARYTTDVNTAPYEPLFDAFDEEGDFDSVEAKFQLSLKGRLWADQDRDLGVWFAYTQQNQWQVYNGDLSSPFRETNYTPELFVNFQPGIDIGGWQWNLLNAGYNHQSNGRSDPISRSWDRLFVEGGIERGNVALLARAWARIRPGSYEDDNPDITDYLGYGELTGIWKRDEGSYKLKIRGNPSTGKGAGEFTWTSRPILGPMKAYVQVFSGYGESMIDYDWNQTTFGAGLALNDVL
jgi:phospholipase A1